MSSLGDEGLETGRTDVVVSLERWRLEHPKLPVTQSMAAFYLGIAAMWRRPYDEWFAYMQELGALNMKYFERMLGTQTFFMGPPEGGPPDGGEHINIPAAESHELVDAVSRFRIRTVQRKGAVVADS